MSEYPLNETNITFIWLSLYLGTTKKCENKNLNYFFILIQFSEMQVEGSVNLVFFVLITL